MRTRERTRAVVETSSDVETPFGVETLDVTFHALGAGGEAVGRDGSGRTVFAPLAAPGDQSKVAVVEAHSRFARGVVTQITRASANRVAPPCAFYQSDDVPPRPRCGGCQWQHIEYSMQLSAKRDLLVQALQRIGKVENADELVAPCVASPQQFAYRNKADFVVSANGEITEIGFHAHSSHRVVDVARCLIQNETNNALLHAVREATQRGFVAPFDARSNGGVLQRVVARTASNGEALCIVVTTRAAWPQAVQFAAFMRERVPQLVGVLRRSERDKPQLLSGRDWLEETVDGLRLRVTSDGFFQINTAMTPRLLQTALELAQIENEDRVLDLYCGVGLFALAAARAGAQVTGIEQNAAAIENAKINAQRNALSAEFIAGDATEVLRRRREKTASQSERCDVVILDPPRAGATACLEEIAFLQPRRIVYVSCDAATLARDVGVLRARGFALKRAVPLDLFPQTAHVESVALLEML